MFELSIYILSSPGYFHLQPWPITELGVVLEGEKGGNI